MYVYLTLRHTRGRTTKENGRTNWSCPNVPSLMKMAAVGAQSSFSQSMMSLRCYSKSRRQIFRNEVFHRFLIHSSWDVETHLSSRLKYYARASPPYLNRTSTPAWVRDFQVSKTNETNNPHKNKKSCDTSKSLASCVSVCLTFCFVSACVGRSVLFIPSQLSLPRKRPKISFWLELAPSIATSKTLEDE